MNTNTKLIALTLLVSSLALSQTQAQKQSAIDNQAPATTSTLGSDAAGPGLDGPGMGRPGLDGAGLDGPGRQKRHDGPGQHRGPGRGMEDRQPGNGPGGRGGLTSLTTVSGTVGQWTGNDDMILDGFTLTGGSASTVKFPAHLGQQVQKAVKPGSTISVTGFTETSPRGESVFKMTSLTSGKTTVTDSPVARPAPSTDTPALVTATGKIVDYKLDRGGRVSGLVLDDKTIVRVPPHVASQLTNLATKGTAITVQGYPKTIHDGQVQLEKVNILRASVLTINGQQYLVR